MQGLGGCSPGGTCLFMCLLQSGPFVAMDTRIPCHLLPQTWMLFPSASAHPMPPESPRPNSKCLGEFLSFAIGGAQLLSGPRLLAGGPHAGQAVSSLTVLFSHSPPRSAPAGCRIHSNKDRAGPPAGCFLERQLLFSAASVCLALEEQCLNQVLASTSKSGEVTCPPPGPPDHSDPQGPQLEVGRAGGERTLGSQGYSCLWSCDAETQEPPDSAGY